MTALTHVETVVLDVQLVITKQRHALPASLQLLTTRVLMFVHVLTATTANPQRNRVKSARSTALFALKIQVLALNVPIT